MQTMATMLPNALLVIGMFSVMMVLDPTFTALAVMFSPLMMFSTHRSTIALKAASRRARKADGQVAAAATEGPQRDPPGAGVHPREAPGRPVLRTHLEQPRGRSRGGPAAGALRPGRRRDLGAVHGRRPRLRGPAGARRPDERRRAAGVPVLPQLALQAGQGALPALGHPLARAGLRRAGARRAVASSPTSPTAPARCPPAACRAGSSCATSPTPTAASRSWTG